MGDSTFILRAIEPADLAGAIKLSNAEGWNQTEKDWRFLMENPGSICLLAECNKKVIGTTTAINYSNKVSWVGMVLVDQEFRGQGVSNSLLTTIFKRIKSISVKLDATPEGQRVYKKFDFNDEYLIARMSNPAVNISTSAKDHNNISLLPVQLKDIEEIITYDESVFGAGRAKLIEFLVREYPEKAWSLNRNNHIAGFALGRGGNRYHHIGPVLTSGAADAKILIAKSLERLIGQPVIVDVLCDKEELITWLSSIGFVKERCFVRMYQKANLFPGRIENQFLICGPEFG